MKQTLYGDVLFLVNFSMDFLTLYITALILHRSVKKRRFVLSAAIGGVYGVAACFMGGALIFRIGSDVLYRFRGKAACSVCAVLRHGVSARRGHDCRFRYDRQHTGDADGVR